MSCLFTDANLAIILYNTKELTYCRETEIDIVIIIPRHFNFLSDSVKEKELQLKMR